MTNFPKIISLSRYKFLLGVLLITASIISVTLVKLHGRITGVENYSFLVWNLFLAWIPYFASLAAYFSMRHRVTFFLVMPVCTLVWLVFFPNSSYLLTDFQHLAITNLSSPLWFDVIILLWFAWTGLLIGIGSLYQMQEIVTLTFNPIWGWIFAIVVTSLSSVGVYMGRFLRWNSWDILQDPLPIAKDVYGIVRHPRSNLPTYVFTILFTLLFLFIYISIHVFGGIIRERNKTS